MTLVRGIKLNVPVASKPLLIGVVEQRGFFVKLCFIRNWITQFFGFTTVEWSSVIFQSFPCFTSDALSSHCLLRF